ncbi:MAG: NADH-quinone oxidoreductase subunit B, partial [Candidatus Kapaibacteriota bacterium]
MGLDKLLGQDGFLTTTVESVLKWAQKSSVWPMPLGISCCAIEMMAFASPRFDVARFGSEVFRMTPRQSDLLIVAGTVTYKMAWVVRKIYDQMP